MKTDALPPDNQFQDFKPADTTLANAVDYLDSQLNAMRSALTRASRAQRPATKDRRRRESAAQAREVYGAYLYLVQLERDRARK